MRRDRTGGTAVRRSCAHLAVAAGWVLVFTGAAGVGEAGEADVVVARAECTAERVCAFSVTVKHADTGWRHYADRFEIVGPDGTVLATRVLQHPHVHEQPFTRKLAAVEVPAGVERVTVRAHDSEHGDGGDTVEVDLVFPRAGAAADAQGPTPEAAPAP